jgi:thiol-disulfide isomerase/thioredoxin
MKLILVFAIFLILSCNSSQPTKTGLEGKTLPTFNLLLADSTTWFNTKNIPEGKPTVLISYSPRCPYCRAQMEEIVEDIDKLKEIQFYLITTYPFQEMKHFYAQYKLNKYNNIISGRDTANFLANYFEATAVPYLAIYGKEKKLKEVFVGKIYSSQIKKAAFN